MATQWLTVEEVLEELQISRSAWNKRRAKGAGPAARRLPNGSLRIKGADLDEWLDSLEAA